MFIVPTEDYVADGAMTMADIQEIVEENNQLFIAQAAATTLSQLYGLRKQATADNWQLTMMAANGYLADYGASVDMSQGQEVAMEALSRTTDRLQAMVKNTIDTARANSNKRLLKFTGWFKFFQSTTTRLLDSLENEELFVGDIPMSRYMPVLSINGAVNDLRAEFLRLTGYFDRVMNNNLQTEIRQILSAANQTQRRLTPADLVAFWANLYCRNLEINIETPEMSPAIVNHPYHVVRSDIYMGNFYHLIKAVPFTYQGFQTGWGYAGPIQRVLPKAATQEYIRAYPKATIIEVITEVSNRVNGWTGAIKNGYAAENNVWNAWSDMFNYWSSHYTEEQEEEFDALLYDFQRRGGEKIILDFIAARNNLIIQLYQVTQALMAFAKGHLPQKK